MKNKLGLIIVLIIVFLMMSCANITEEDLDLTNTSSSGTEILKEAPDVTITSASGTELFYVVGYNSWNGAVFDRIGTLDTYMGMYNEEDIPYVEIGETITIDFADNIPDFVQLTDEVFYTNMSPIELDIRGSETSFSLKPFSYEKAYIDAEQNVQDNTRDLRGFILLCVWGENACEYGFMLNTSKISTVEYDPTDPYLKLVGAEFGDLTEEDFKLLLTTPVEELEIIYGLDPPEIPEEGTPEYQLFLMYYNIQDGLPIDGLLMQYQGADRTQPPALLNFDGYGSLLGIELPTEFGSIETEWGEKDRRLYYNPMGNIERQWQAADYHRGGLVYSFRSRDVVDISSIGLTQQTMLDYDRIHWDELPQATARVVITLDDDNKFYLLL